MSLAPGLVLSLRPYKYIYINITYNPWKMCFSLWECQPSEQWQCRSIRYIPTQVPGGGWREASVLPISAPHPHAWDEMNWWEGWLLPPSLGCKCLLNVPDVWLSLSGGFFSFPALVKGKPEQVQRNSKQFPVWTEKAASLMNCTGWQWVQLMNAVPVI